MRFCAFLMRKFTPGARLKNRVPKTIASAPVTITLRRMQSRPRVALLVETSNAYARDILYGIRGYQREQGAWSIYLSEHGRGDIIPPWLRRWNGDGIIARVENESIAAALLATKLPTVDVSFGLERSPFPRVATDSNVATRLAAEHLCDRGFKHFAYCGDARYHWSNMRRRHFAEHLRKAGFTCDVFPDPNIEAAENSWEKTIGQMTRWVRHLPRPVGILACYDIRGQQVLEACRRLSVQVPDEVAVIGVHNDELLCDLCDPPLSSVIPNARRAGYEAARLLTRMMNGEKVSPQAILLEPVGVATRQSTDVVALDDPKLSQAVRFIREHACGKLTVDDVLRAVPMSRTAFERRFKEALRCTPHEHILRVRLNHVKNLLTTTDLTLSAIAERSGFEHSEYMSFAFKRNTGISPGAFRTKNKA
jgi:LacI family transcriptional regulator